MEKSIHYVKINYKKIRIPTLLPERETSEQGILSRMMRTTQEDITVSDMCLLSNKASNAVNQKLI